MSRQWRSHNEWVSCAIRIEKTELIKSNDQKQFRQNYDLVRLYLVVEVIMHDDTH